ncbi:MAG TPA: hypothetical protein DCE44_06285 [Verrucomicrobiales bacterium]|nr:hypothetical protein [Verrucomicrobiales bacterium]
MHLRFLPLVFATFGLFASPSEDMSFSARAFLGSLTTEQKERAAFPFTSDERQNWHFVPKDRKGLPLKDMTPTQRHLAYGLLSSGLSQRGVGKALSIMSLEQVLQDIEGPNRKIPRDPELYYVSVFGTPDPAGTWGWRVEGHHLSVNVTIVAGELISGAPNFFGSNPGEVKSGPRAGLRVLGAEEDLGRQLVKSLDESQRKLAIIDPKAPDDILTSANRVADVGAAKGIGWSELTPTQQALALKLLNEYAGRLRGELAEADLAEIHGAGLAQIRFAWAGGLERGERHYYRLHGPTFLVEYDNTQNDANHVHAVWRDLKGDFGRDLLAEHLKDNHRK